MDASVQCAISVLEQAANGGRADVLLREKLKGARLSREQSRRTAELVFAYFRWLGLLDAEVSFEEQIARAEKLDLDFARAPDRFSTETLLRAFPAWLAEEVVVSRELLCELQSRPKLWLRARPGQGAALAKKLGHCWRGEGMFADTLRYDGTADLFRTPEFQAGEFEIQDIASQCVSLLCDPRPGETWWDACAGEGGKTLHFSDLMQNQGLIWASDRAEWRLKKLKQRAARARVFNYRTAPWDGGSRLPVRTPFHGVLVDAPCSGVGTWQRNPDARWTTTREDVRELAELQQRLVLHAAAAVRPGGRLIYAVCTLTRSETNAVADLCSPRLSGFAPFPLPALPSEPPAASDRKWIWPHRFAGNGMFVAAWKRFP